MPEEANIGAIVRNERIYMPSDDLLLSIDDHLIVFFTDKRAIPEIENYFREV
jgi:Trk K+ transport system NAD-binding subunit